MTRTRIRPGPGSTAVEQGARLTAAAVLAAGALGVNPKTAMRYAERAGTDHLGYAALRSPRGPEDA